MPPSSNYEEFQQALAAAKRIAVVAGAGLSAASGGFWRKHDVHTIGQWRAFIDNPSRVWCFYHYRREVANLAHPNAAHYALAQLSIPALRSNVAPNADFTLITQNVDGLSPRALLDLRNAASDTALEYIPGGEETIIEMHGSIHDVSCTCGALARPAVTFFGEVPEHMDRILQLVGDADMCLVVGTSSTVHPAAGFADTMKKHGGKVAVFNIEPTKRDGAADFLFLVPCDVTLPDALGFKVDHSLLKPGPAISPMPGFPASHTDEVPPPQEPHTIGKVNTPTYLADALKRVFDKKAQDTPDVP